MSPIKQPTSIFSNLVVSLLVIALVLGALSYLAFQARFLITGPQIALSGEVATLQSERVVTLSGTANNITAIYLNGRPIVTDEHGVFEEEVILENGYSLVTIEAVDRYGRRTALERSFVYDSPLLN